MGTMFFPFEPSCELPSIVFMTYSLWWMQLKECRFYIMIEKLAKRKCSGKWYVLWFFHEWVKNNFFYKSQNTSAIRCVGFSPPPTNSLTQAGCPTTQFSSVMACLELSDTIIQVRRQLGLSPLQMLMPSPRSSVGLLTDVCQARFPWPLPRFRSEVF